jgi:hypothetical protein
MISFVNGKENTSKTLRKHSKVNFYELGLDGPELVSKRVDQEVKINFMWVVSRQDTIVSEHKL